MEASYKINVLRFIVILSFLRSFSFGSIWSFLILFLVLIFNLSLSFAGLFVFISGIVGALSQILAGAVSDSFGRKRMVILGLAGQGLSFIFIGIFVVLKSIYSILLGMILINFFSGFYFSSINAIVADIMDKNERFGGYALLRAAANFGWGIGPAIGGFIFYTKYFNISFFAIGALLSLLSLYMIKFPETAKVTSRFRFNDMMKALKNLKFLLYCVAAFISFLIFGQFNSTFAVYESEVNGISSFYIGLAWTLNGFLVGFTQYFFAKLANTSNQMKFLIYGIIIYGFGYFSTIFSSSIWWMFVSVTIITLGELIFSSTANAVAMNMANEEDIGKYSGTYNFFTFIGRAFGPLYGGLIFSLYLPYDYMWGIIFLTALFASFLFLLIDKFF